MLQELINKYVKNIPSFPMPGCHLSQILNNCY
uniref:Uncharacterized protein n=1 Tax=Rhizophora mucronata TaxID=61149 RepID=A0A2P2IUA9_RHIMU